MSEPTPSLEEFRASVAKDDNYFWRLSDGGHQNLLDEALDLLDERETEIKNLKSYIHNWYTPEIERLRLALNEAADDMADHGRTQIAAYRYRKIARGEGRY